MADKYLLRVTAGPSYDPSTHTLVNVNTPTPTHISSSLCTASVSVRIQNYRGLPRDSPTTSPYFSHPPHTHDQYSIAFSFRPKKDIPGSALVFGNDFDYPVRDRLPPGFGTALRIAKWAIDPGLDGDPYADKPYLYGNALSSVNILRVGPKVEGKDEAGEDIGTMMKGDEERGIEEGGEGGGEEVRQELGVPEAMAERKKWFLGEEGKAGWKWEAGRVYWGDFYNPYLDFNDFSLKLPGFSMSVLSYLGGEDSLRYVLKNKESGEVYFVVVFTLLHKEDVEKEDREAVDRSEESIKTMKKDVKGTVGEEKAGEEGTFEPGEDDVD